MIVHRKSEVSDNDASSRRRSSAAHRLALSAGLLVLAATVPVQAEMAAQPDSFAAGAAPLSSAELQTLRGGMRINGVDFDFGAIVRVFVDGPMVAETALTLNPDGSIARSTTIHDTSSTTPFTSLSQLNGSDLHFGNLDNADGFVISGPTGLSVALNSIKAGNITGLLANDAAGRNITQTIEVSVTINNFTQINSNLQSSIAMGRAISAALPNAVLAH